MSNEKREMRKEKLGKGARGKGLVRIGYDMKKVGGHCATNFFIIPLWGDFRFFQ